MTAESFEEEEVQQLLVEIAKENGFEEPRYEIASATKAGDNYLGRVLRAVIHEGGPNEKEQLSLIFKTAPSGKCRRDTFRTGIVFNNEGNMYNNVLPKLNDVLKEFGLSDSDIYPCTPRCIKAKLSADPSDNDLDVLVLEDMAPQGYGMVDRAAGLDGDKCRVILRHLAHLHGSSLALQTLRPDEAAEINSTVREIAFESENPLLGQMVPIVQNSIGMIMERFPPDTPEFAKVKEFVDSFMETTCELVKPNDQLSCVTHGDCWSNNVLFKFAEDGAVEKICLIDFQVARIASPILDISYMMFTCTNKKVRDAHYRSLLQDYYDELCSVLSKAGCDPEAVIPWSVFEEQLKTYGKYGLGMALITTPLFLADSSEVPDDIDGALENGNNSLAAIFGNVNIKKLEECKTRISDVVQDCIELGYL